MAQQQNLPNGVLPQMENVKQNMLPSQAMGKLQFNGMSSSSHSSRDPSPSARLNQIPASQLPPRLPPAFAPQHQPPLPATVTSSDVFAATQKVNQLQIGDGGAPPSTAATFGTSTPKTSANQGNASSLTNSFTPTSAFSPITPSSVKNQPPPFGGDHQQNIDSSNTLTASQISATLGSANTAAKTQNYPPAANLVVSQNHGHSVNTGGNVNASHVSSSSVQSNVNPPSQAGFQQVSLGPTNSITPGYQQGKINEPPRTSQSVFQQQAQNVPPFTATSTPTSVFFQPQNVGYAAQTSTAPASRPSGPPKLSGSMSQPKLLPSNVNQHQTGLQQNATTQPFASQPGFGSTPNLYQSTQLQNGPTPPMSVNKPPQQTYQVPQSSRFMNQQRPSLFSNRYPSMNVSNNLQSQTPASLPVMSQQHFNQNPQQFNQQQQAPQQQQQFPQPNQQQYGQYNQQQLYNQQQQTGPLQPPQQQQPKSNAYQQPFTQPNYPGYQPSVATLGFNKLWGNEHHDLLQNPNILPPTKIQAPKVSLGQEALDNANCSPDIVRCTMTKIPENNSLLQKSRLPLGILIHPFKDLSHLPVIQCNVIVRCRACRTYINPFVYFVDNKRWKCNLCYRINELPEEFQYDPVSKTYGDPSRRPEVRSSTIEYIAPAEYMLRPPQPAVYLFLMDISQKAVESGYLHTLCSVLLDELKNLPGDARTQIGFIGYDSALHFFSLAEGLSQPHEMTVLDIEDAFLPCPDNLLVNLKDRMELVIDLLNQLPTRYNHNFDNNSALGAALQVAHKLMSPTGGRVTVFQASLPNVGPGALTSREVINQRSSTTEAALLNPANDFYKRLSLDCNAQQIAVDLFTVNSQFIDLGTISGISRFSAGCMYHFPLFKAQRPHQGEAFERSLRRYLTRKIGFEAVMRIRCTRGLSIHTFHGNFFVRSTDLLSLPNTNPDAGYGMQVAIDESLTELQTVCFQAALLYTSSKGERRIRVHTLCLPIVSTLHDVINAADQQCIVGLLAKMAVDRSLQSSLSDAREAFINVGIDILSSYRLSLNLGSGMSGLLAPECMKLLPLYISALLKYTAFRTGTPTRLDDRIKAMMDMKTKPLCQLMQQVYPDMYPVHNLEEQQVVLNSEEEPVCQPPHLQLTARCLETRGAFLMDTGDHMMLYVGSGVSEVFVTQVLGVPNFNSIPDEMFELPVLENPHSKRLHQFVNYLNDDKPFAATLQVIRDNSNSRLVFLERLIEDRLENALSYHEFLQHLKSHVK